MLHAEFPDSFSQNLNSKPSNVAFRGLVDNVDVPATTLAECTQRVKIAQSCKVNVYNTSKYGKTVNALTHRVIRNCKYSPWSVMVTEIVT